jgi:pimeloyl-ACP methyl ester carboxylesterase
MKLFDERKKPQRTNHLTPPMPLSIPPITDKAGLNKAYGRGSKLYTHGNTLYIAGTSSLQDVWDDLKIPFNQTAHSERYRKAASLLKVNKDIQNVVGHSLGGSVALELQKNFPDRKFKSNTYGAPVFSISGADNRFRNYFDPVSILDRGADNSLHVGLNPHSFVNFDTNKVSNKAFNTFTYTPGE